MPLNKREEQLYMQVENWQDRKCGCALMAAKSKLKKGTVPRNELSAILSMTGLAFIVRKSQGEQVDEIVYATDSMIALLHLV